MLDSTHERLHCVRQVAWQSLVEASEGSVMDDSGAGRASLVGAVITPRRAILVSVTLTPLAAAPAASAGAAFTGGLWVGPALLLTTASHQVGVAFRAWQCRAASSC